ncbi:hypothetical protein C8R47DRAFT_150829 [Mycena vitilis]|nr:hypothetical protein C8R47DRAFT_150829 [Mycena vitilis]
MAFFAQSSVVIHGGTFYSASGDVNVQTDHQPTVEASEFNSELRIPSAIGSERFVEACQDTCPVRDPKPQRFDGRRFHPYNMADRGRDAARLSPLKQHNVETANSHVYRPTLPSHPLQPEGGANALWTNVPWPDASTSQPTTIYNGTFIGNNTVRNGESGINILHRVSVAEAFHDAADTVEQPRCHPETRLEMHAKLLNWCFHSEWPRGWKETAYETEPIVLWVHGPAGAGKSAIMRTLSQRLENEGRLGGAFFFKRGHATRGNARVLFATLALQLAVNSSYMTTAITRTVEKNPTLVGRSINVQLRELILRPCIGLDGLSMTIIIDGLDECEGQTVQQEILRLILNTTDRQTPLRFIIASRPEAHIRDVLEEVSSHGLYRPFDVESSFNDVRIYLVTEFARIHREHSTMADIPTPWPSEDVIDRLVNKSSGYFIYASTVVSFVDDKDFRPTQRLDVLEHGSGSGSDSPFGALDELYIQILSDVPKNHHLVPILRVMDNIPDLSVSDSDMLLRLHPGDTRLCLRRLQSVITIGGPSRHDGDAYPAFCHASFSDFLRDPFRAGGFYTGESVGLVDLARLVFTELAYDHQDPVKNEKGPPGLYVHLMRL